MGNRIGISTLLLLALLCTTGAAYGAPAPSSPGDPPSGSPAGAVYQLPFEEGRADASPKGSGGTNAPGAGGDEQGGGATPGTAGNGSSGSSESSTSGTQSSLYRSENNFGSSSQVPGAPAEGGAGGGTSGSAGGAGGGSGGSSGTDAPLGLTPGELTDSGNTAPAANLGLLALIGLIAVAVGVISVRAARQHRTQS